MSRLSNARSELERFEQTKPADYQSKYKGQIDNVMDGDLDGFIFAYLKAASRGELQDT